MIRRITDLGRFYKVYIILYFMRELPNDDCLIIHLYFYLCSYTITPELLVDYLQLHLQGSSLSIWQGFLLFFKILQKKDVHPAIIMFGVFPHFFHSCSFRNSAISLPKVIEYQLWTLLTFCFRVSLHDTGTINFRAGASSLRFSLQTLYLFTWYHHKMSYWHESPQSAFYPVTLYWSENFTPGWNMYVNAKQLPILVWNQSAGGLEWVTYFESHMYFINMKCIFK